MQLALFQASPQENAIIIEWQTVSELENLGFNLYRATSADGEQEQLNTELIPSQAPGSGQGAAYQWQDAEVAEGESYYYWLSDVTTDGTSNLHGPISATATNPTAVMLDELETRNAPPAFVAWLLGALAAVGLALRKRKG